MPETTYIPRHKGDAGSAAFETLRRAGIECIQELAGATWTDYNSHDPGVTILEQICYALTDVMYRADFPVPDFLVDDRGAIQWEPQSLLPAETVFPCRPTTATDYRVAILDAVEEVENVAVEPILDKDSKLSGLYRIRLRLRDENAAMDEVAEKVRLTFARTRNLCEDAEAIEFVPSAEYRLDAEVEIREGEDPGEIAAKIYYACGVWLAAGITFLPYDLAMSRGKKAEEMFRGPFASCGMVAEDGGDPRMDFPASEVFTLIKGVEGVESVKAFPGKVDSHGEGPAMLRLHWPQNDDEIGIRVFSRGKERKVSLHELTMRFEELNFANRGLRAAVDGAAIVPRPVGEVRDITGYLSVQYHFPPIYGLGRNRVPESASPIEKARVRQLKGYLLPFDQHLTDYLAMLGNLRHLFSTGVDKRQTYFFQTLDEESFPGIDDVYGRYPAGVLKQLLNPQRFSTRTKRLLDYLLALYGESFRDEFLRQSAPGEDTEEEDAILDARIAYLKDIKRITQDRGAAADYTRGWRDRANRSGLEARLSHLLGFEKEFQANGEGVRVIEHILLRPAGTPFRVSVLFPGWKKRCMDPAFRKYARDTVDAACPAHIYAEIHWIDSREDMDRFDHLLDEWWKRDREARPIRLKPKLAGQDETPEPAHATPDAHTAARHLMGFLNQLEERQGA